MNVSESIHELVASQFAPSAAEYVTSPTHSNPEALAKLVDLVNPRPQDQLLDVATGAGHVALAFAPLVASVVAFDLTPAMLEQVEAGADKRRLTNVSVRQGKAEEMPFADDSFDIVTVRVAPHHFADVSAFVKESYRVLRPGGQFLVVDTIVPESDLLDEELNRLEKLRDPSHVRNYRPSEWVEFVESAGFDIRYQSVGMHSEGKRMELEQWMNRIQTPEENRPEIRGILTNPTPEIAEALDIAREGAQVWFSLPEITLLAMRAHP